MAGKEVRKRKVTYNKDGGKNVYKDRSFSEQTIQRILYKYFKQKKMYYLLANVFMFGGDPGWESDFFFVARNRHLWEIEIKVDRQDYTRDFNKTKKHRLFQDCFDAEDPGKILLPNHFYYCAPEGVIQHDSVPEYAGLIEVCANDKLKFVLKPKLHTEVQEVESILLKKFYNKSLRMEKQLSDFRIALFEEPDPKEQEVIVQKFLKKIRM